MSGLALILKEKGHEVKGSDTMESANVRMLREQGIEVCRGSDIEAVKSAELVVYTAAVTEDDPELRAAREAGVPVIGRAELLGRKICLHLSD